MAKEVGSGQVAIFPTFKGFRAAVSGEVDGAAKDGATGFKRAFQGAGEGAGKETGAGFKGAFSKAAGGVGTDELKKLETGVASASKALSAARLKEQDEAGKVKVAEASLAEAREKSATSVVAARAKQESAAAKVAQAESALAAAVAKSGSASKAAETASTRLAEAKRNLTVADERVRTSAGNTTAAEERLASAQRGLTAVQDTVKTSSDRLADSKRRLAEASAQAATASSTPQGGGFGAIGAAASAAMSAVKSAFSSGFAVVKQTLSDLGTFAGTTLKGIGALATAVVGTAIVAGFNRMTTIENAKAKLAGLGNDQAAVAAIMDSALASVDKTAFGLGEAATVAATAVAAGIKPGEQLTKYLKLTADAATIAGVSMSEMGDIINKTTTTGKVGTENLNQLAERGIPIFGWLAEAYGVSADELQKMVTRGEVDSETFRRVIEENIGGAALASGNTTEGAWKNMRAALGRLGEAILTGPFPLFKDLFNLITTGLNTVTKKIKPFSEAWGPKLTAGFESTVSKIQSGFGRLSESFGKMKDLIPKDLMSGITDALGPGGLILAIGGAVGALGPLLSGIPLLGSLFTGLTGPVGLLVGGIAGLLAVSPQLRDSLAKLGEGALPIVASLFEKIGSVLAGAVQQMLPVVADLFSRVFDVLTSLLPVLGPVVDKLGDVLAGALSNAAPLLEKLADFFGTMLEKLQPLGQPLGDLVTALLDLAAGTFDAVITVLDALFTRTDTSGLDDKTESIDGFKTVIDGLVWVLGLAVSNISIAGLAIQGLADIMNGDFNADGFTKKMEAVPGPIAAFIRWMGDAGVSVAQFAIKVGENISMAVTSVGDGISGMIRWFQNLPVEIVKAVVGLTVSMRQIGTDAIAGLVSGLAGGVRWVKEAAANVANAAVDAAKAALGIKSPSRVMRFEVGQQVGEGYALGIEDKMSRVRSAADQLTSIPTTDPFATSVVAGGAGSSHSSGTPAIYVQNPWTGEYLLARSQELIANANQQEQMALNAGWRIG